MRSRIAILLALCACETPDTLPRPERPPADYASLTAATGRDGGPLVATQRERGIAKAYMDVLSDPALAGLDALFDEDAHFVFAGDEYESHGRIEVRSAHKKLLDALASRTFKARRVLLTDRSQAIAWTMNGKDGSNGSDVGVNGIALVQTKDDGTVSDIHLFYDEGIINAQRGLEPKQLGSGKIKPPPMPSGDPEIVEQAHGSNEERNLQVVSDWLDPGLERDPGKYQAAMSNGIVIETAENPPMTGIAAAMADRDSWHRSIQSLDVQVMPPLIAAGDFVAVEYRLVGTMVNRIGFFPSVNALIQMYGVDIVQVKDGRITHVWRYDDPLQLRTSSTAPPTPARSRP
jgi:ketosteroid isomerase-like protein